MKRGILFTAPPDDSGPFLQARQAQYPPRYSGSREHAMSAANWSLAAATVDEGLKPVRDAWQKMLARFSDQIDRRIYVRDSPLDVLLKPYADRLVDLQKKLEGNLEKSDTMEAGKTVTTWLARRDVPIGYRMCTMTWGNPAEDFNNRTIEDAKEQLKKAVAIADGTYTEWSSLASDSEDGCTSEPSVSVANRNTRSPASLCPGCPQTGREVVINRTGSREQNVEEVF